MTEGKLYDLIREKYTLVAGDEESFTAQFRVGNQSFSITPTDYETKSEAQWMRCMFAKAVAKMVAEIIGGAQ